MRKKDIFDLRTVAYYSGFGGLEIKKIEYGADDHILCVAGAWGGKKTAHRLKIYYNNDKSYIKLHGYRVPLDECIRV